VRQPQLPLAVREPQLALHRHFAHQSASSGSRVNAATAVAAFQNEE
jgi:hypothetical protein